MTIISGLTLAAWEIYENHENQFKGLEEEEVIEELEKELLRYMAPTKKGAAVDNIVPVGYDELKVANKVSDKLRGVSMKTRVYQIIMGIVCATIIFGYMWTITNPKFSKYILIGAVMFYAVFILYKEINKPKSG